MGKLVKATILTFLLGGIALYILISTFAPGESPEAKMEATKKEVGKAIRMAKAALPEPAPGEKGAGLSSVINHLGPQASPTEAAPPKEVEVTVEATGKSLPPAVPAEGASIDAAGQVQVPPPAEGGTPAPPSSATPAPVIHVVAPGETLSTIAEKFYGRSSGWKRIAKANPGINPDCISVGAKLVIPEAKANPDGEEIASPETPAPVPQDYEVKAGDTLYGIAERMLGKGSRWKEIVEVNPGLDPDNLVVGQKVRIPR
ncbi:MAG: LysM peptidoglycan-binding domain-containing protein [Planctomycetota bacterium]|jgi:nucleoid-associated protein YgaU